MATTDIRPRGEVDRSLQWNLDDLFRDRQEWSAAVEELREQARRFEAFRGRLGESGRVLLDALEAEDRIGSRAERVYAYAMFCHDQDTQDADGTEMMARAQAARADLGQATAFAIPELVALPEGRLQELQAQEPGLAVYAHMLREVERLRAHVLAPDEEALLAALSPVLGGAGQVAGQLSNADMQFPDAETEDGSRLPLTHGRYGQYMESTDRTLRRTAYLGMHGPYRQHRHTFAATLDQEVRGGVIEARLRRYSSALEAALDMRALPASLYDNLIAEVHDALPMLHRYVDWRKQRFGLSEIHFYDLYPPVVADAQPQYDWQEACEMVLRGLRPLGPRYRERLERCLAGRYIDVMENQGKRSGAYSMDIYEVHPYILMSYTGTRDSVFTLAHELGHSMHSILAREAQNFRNAQYPIFLAEIASTTNEHLLLRHLIAEARDPKVQLDLRDDLAQKFLGTVFRQTLFAEFERAIHERIEQGGGLTAEYLRDTYADLLRIYYGPELVIDDDGTWEWARIPHFYMGYYVFQYATGFISASALAQAILREGDEAAERYLGFLESGGSDDPLPILRRAGVDLQGREALRAGLAEFGRVVDDLGAERR